MHTTPRPTALTLLSLALAASCAPRIDLPLGESCSVQFRRDALGAGAPLPIAPTTDRYNGATTALHGTLERADDRWLVLRVPLTGKDYWIARDAVLLIEAQTP